MEEPAILAEEPATVVEEPVSMVDDPTWLVEEPVLPAEDSTKVVEKSIEELFNKAYAKDPIPDDLLGQLCRGQTRFKLLLLAEYKEDGNG